jgi:hypothetical protein
MFVAQSTLYEFPAGDSGVIDRESRTAYRFAFAVGWNWIVLDPDQFISTVSSSSIT